MSEAEATEPANPTEALVGSTVADRYRIDALLGAGGMGAVYKATHVHMQKTVALKLLHPQMANVPEVLARFEREAVAAATISHPNLASALDFGKLPDNSFYLVMEYIPGQLLRDALSAGAMSPERVARIGVQIAAALEAAHAAGIVHRDLKPENVILRTPGAQEQVKVLDLGIAKVPVEATGGGTALTKVGAVLGTPQYMSPEQAIGMKIDHRSDLYALGVVLYEMASGKPPFSDDDGARAVIARHIAEPPPALPAAVPAPIASLIRELLEKSAAARPQSAAEVVQRLQDALAAPPEKPAAPREAELESASSASAVAANVRPTETRRRIVLAAGAVVLVGLGAWLAKTAASTASAPTPSSSATVSAAAESATALVPPARGTSRDQPASAPSAVSSASEPASTAQPPARSGTRTTPQRRKTVKKEERRTGPGGIYIPPPKDWF